MTRFIAAVGLLIYAIDCGGRLTSDEDAGDATDASADVSHADAQVEICGAFGRDSGAYAPYGSCPPGWHCDLRKVTDALRNVCCPSGQSGDSDQCINPQN